MPIFDFRTATLGSGARSKLRIMREHLRSVFLHMTLVRLWNLISSECNRILGKSSISSMPFFLKIESTGLCNLDCNWCTGSKKRDRQAGERSTGRMSLKDFVRILDQTSQFLFRINLYGFGEPFLFPETFEMIKEASSRNIGVVISSNMNTDSSTLTENILSSGLELMIFSCHGTSNETVKKFMGNSADMHLALRNVEELIRERNKRKRKFPVIQWQYCVTGFNEHEMENAEEITKKLKIDAIRFIKPWFPPGADDEWYSSIFPRRSTRQSDYSRLSCSWPYRGAYISWDGGVLPCCREELYPENDFGNLLADDFQSIWNGSRFVQSRKLIKNPGVFKPDCRTICTTCPVLGFKPRIPVWEQNAEEKESFPATTQAEKQ